MTARVTRVYLDDARDAPDESWTLVRTPEEAFRVILTNCDDIQMISLDHDLGDDVASGYDVLMDLLEAFEFQLPFQVLVHTANPVARLRMEQAVRDQDRFRRIVTGEKKEAGEPPASS